MLAREKTRLQARREEDLKEAMRLRSERQVCCWFAKPLQPVSLPKMAADGCVAVTVPGIRRRS